jgi:hypothetical protein
MNKSPSDASGSMGEVAGVVQRTIVNGEMPALVVVHDDDGDWLIGDGVNDPNEDGACGIFHLGHIVSMDPTLAEVMNLPIGYSAMRETASSVWEISRWEYED